MSLIWEDIVTIWDYCNYIWEDTVTVWEYSNSNHIWDYSNHIWDYSNTFREDTVIIWATPDEVQHMEDTLLAASARFGELPVGTPESVIDREWRVLRR
jgi:hypothetical protein